MGWKTCRHQPALTTPISGHPRQPINLTVTFPQMGTSPDSLQSMLVGMPILIPSPLPFSILKPPSLASSSPTARNLSPSENSPPNPAKALLENRHPCAPPAVIPHDPLRLSLFLVTCPVTLPARLQLEIPVPGFEDIPRVLAAPAAKPGLCWIKTSSKLGLLLA